MATDPVCGMTVDEETAAGSAEYEQKRYYFCSTHCLHKFQAAPRNYTRPAEKSAVPAAVYTCPMHPEIRQDAPGTCPKCGMALEPLMPQSPPTPVKTATEYVCPMHPEIVRNEPGSCPICGMALEPRTVSLEEAENPELVDMNRRFWFSTALALPLFLIAMAADLAPEFAGRFLSHAAIQWVQFLLATPAVLWGGWPFFRRGWRSLITRQLNMFTLIAMGVGAAYLFSAVAMLAPGLFPESMRHHGNIGIYFEAAAVIVTLVLLGQVLELRARNRTGSAIRALLDLAPPTARRVQDSGEDEEVPLEEVRVNDLLRVRPGDKIPWMAKWPRAARA
jgi:P-type Cu+ transporter